MRRRIPRSKAPRVDPDVHPVARVSTEFHLRGLDLLTQVQGDLVQALIVMTLVGDQMKVPRRPAGSVRALSRRLDMPVETARRHVRLLVRSGACALEEGGVVLPPAVLRSRRVVAFLRRIYVNAVRLLVDLTRIEVAAFASASRRPVQSGRLAKEQTVIALAATGLLLAGIRALRGFWAGDLMKGLVYTAIWTANVKHVTNTAPAADRGVLPDSQRLPVSVLAISRSLRLPYETVRRHAEVLVREGIAVRVGRRGMLIPTASILRVPAGPVIAHRLVTDFLAELRGAGVKV
ncbi:MAG: hypothetical protein ACOY4R_29425 [Pseudomonadota bacterium]